MTTKNKNRLAVLGLIGALVMIGVLTREDPADERPVLGEADIERLKAEHEAERQNVADLLARDREARGEDAPTFAELYRSNQARVAARKPAPEAAVAERRQRALGSLWVYDLSPEFLRAESFGETLHVTVSAEFNRGWLVYPCSSQREFVSDLFAEWKRRNASAHTVKLFNPGGGEIGKFSRLWGYHCGD